MTQEEKKKQKILLASIGVAGILLAIGAYFIGYRKGYDIGEKAGIGWS